MMTRRKTRRRGMTIVESALVLSVFCMILFGIFEYCRFLYVLHVTNNAARDGARYAAVNMDKPGNFDTTDYTDSSGTTFPSVQKYTTARMGGADRQLVGYQVAVYPVDPTGLALSPAVIRPMSSSTSGSPVYPDPFNPSDPNRVPWNQTSFPGLIAVGVRGTYQPLLPGFMLMPSSVPVLVTSTTSSEG
jgi:Flp pilus assembly protein TadG